MLAVAFPLGALNATDGPDQDPTVTLLLQDKAQLTRQAVHLGYAQFQRRLNTSEMTSTDRQIALLISAGFQTFFNKVNLLENATPQQWETVKESYTQEFGDLVRQLSQLFLKNQTHYVNPLLLDNQTAAEETLLIVQEAIEQGHF